MYLNINIMLKQMILLFAKLSLLAIFCLLVKVVDYDLLIMFVVLPNFKD